MEDLDREVTGGVPAVRCCCPAAAVVGVNDGPAAYDAEILTTL